MSLMAAARGAAPERRVLSACGGDATADAVVEAMRPGTLSKLGLGYEILKELNPKIVFCTLSGYGATGPYQNMPSHGIAYDTWAGLITPAVDEEGFTRIPRDMPNVGINVGPMLGAFALLAGIPPIYGLYGSFLPLLVYGLLSSSNYLNVGPVAIISIFSFTIF